MQAASAAYIIGVDSLKIENKKVPIASEKDIPYSPLAVRFQTIGRTKR